MKCACDLVLKGNPVVDEKVIKFALAIQVCPLCEAAPELLRLLDLLVMEFKSDPTSVMCFDLRIVQQAIALTEKLQS